MMQWRYMQPHCISKCSYRTYKIWLENRTQTRYKKTLCASLLNGLHYLCIEAVEDYQYWTKPFLGLKKSEVSYSMLRKIHTIWGNLLWRRVLRIFFAQTTLDTACFYPDNRWPNLQKETILLSNTSAQTVYRHVTSLHWSTRIFQLKKSKVIKQAHIVDWKYVKFFTPWIAKSTRHGTSCFRKGRHGWAIAFRLENMTTVVTVFTSEARIWEKIE